MNDNFKYVDINIGISNDNLYLSENTILNIEIRNTSEYKLENGLFKVTLDKDVFQLVDDKFETCLIDFISIGEIEPGYKININIPLKVTSIPIEKVSSIFYSVNFHIIKNDNLIDLSYTSDHLSINLFSLKKLDSDDFKLSSPAQSYTLDDDLSFEINIKNTIDQPLINLKITNYIPEFTCLIKESIDSSNLNNLIITDESIIIQSLNPNEDISIYYKVNLDESISTHTIINTLKLFYKIDNKELSNTSNTLVLPLSNNSLFDESTFSYSIDKHEVTSLDEVIHNIKISNNSNIYLSNLILKNDFYEQVNFIKDSLIINDIYRVGESICEDIILGDLDLDDELNITFKTICNDSLKSVETYFLLEFDTPKRHSLHQSEIHHINVLFSDFNNDGISKSQSMDLCNIGDIVDFNIKLTNKGNAPAKNIYLRDELPVGFEIITDSILVNSNIPNDIIDLSCMFIDEINPNDEFNITYRAKAIEIAIDNFHKCCIEYNINNDPIKIYSNINFIKVIGAKIGNNNFIKKYSTTTAQIGDIISVIMSIENTGNITCENLKILEPLNQSIEFIENSLYIDNNLVENGNIMNGINIPKLSSGEKVDFKYQIKILDFPRPNPIQDRSSLEYIYFCDKKMKSNIIHSTRPKLYINNPNLNIIDKHGLENAGTFIKYAHINDYIFYNLVFENIGNVGIENISMNVKLPDDLILHAQSIKINNAPYIGESLTYIKLPSLNVSQRLSVQFYIKHNFIESYNLESTIYVNYAFKDLKTKESLKRSKKLKTDILIINPDLEITKFVADKDLECSNDLVENINIKNTGNIPFYNLNLLLNNNNFFASCDKTVFLDGRYEDTKDNINIATLDIDETAHIAIRYSVDEIPLCESILNESDVSASYKYLDNTNEMHIKRKSNKVKLDVKDYSLYIKGKSFSNHLLVNDISSYSLNILNNGNVHCENARIQINLPDTISYIEGSININGSKKNINTLSTYIDLGMINCNESINIGFDLKVDAFPYNKFEKILAVIEGDFLKNNEIISKSFNFQSQAIYIDDISLNVVKSVSHDYLQHGDTLKIQTVLDNNGTVNLEKICIKDNINKNLSYVLNSAFINGEPLESVNPIDGIVIDSLEKGESILLNYEYDYIPKTCSNNISVFSNIEYLYKFKDDEYKKCNLKTDSIYIEGALSVFKQFNIENEFSLREYEPDLLDIVKVYTDAKIEDFYEVNNNKNKYFSNRISADKKIIIKGFSMARIEYLTKENPSNLYMLERNNPFTMFVTLPNDSNCNELLFRAKCEDTFYKSTGSRSIFISTLVSIEGLV